MLAYPHLDELLEKSGAEEYTLVIESAKRARQLNDEEPVVECETNKPVSNALEEIMAGRLKHKSADKE
ncbi:DNA-directed RNA polymerase subunit omega [Sporohalobacter salinus]|uniref:DNA-directed RNA polymerase subunit omega n=1 Tax=Sporohalobacter salinus TaxID=1494606 RepID=UPI001961E216|nr:DNA-directed RNA polymerase subunit omega [Sporohalobacter salinus]MBM7623296.1 DNA-directed RNA polymerase subunit omega [Sporohalobacter salinus]